MNQIKNIQIINTTEKQDSEIEQGYQEYQEKILFELKNYLPEIKQLAIINAESPSWIKDQQLISIIKIKDPFRTESLNFLGLIKTQTLAQPKELVQLVNSLGNYQLESLIQDLTTIDQNKLWSEIVETTLEIKAESIPIVIWHLENNKFLTITITSLQQNT